MLDLNRVGAVAAQLSQQRAGLPLGARLDGDEPGGGRGNRVPPSLLTLARPQDRAHNCRRPRRREKSCVRGQRHDELGVDRSEGTARGQEPVGRALRPGRPRGEGRPLRRRRDPRDRRRAGQPQGEPRQERRAARDRGAAVRQGLAGPARRRSRRRTRSGSSRSRSSTARTRARTPKGSPSAAPRSPARAGTASSAG